MVARLLALSAGVLASLAEAAEGQLRGGGRLERDDIRAFVAATPPAELAGVLGPACLESPRLLAYLPSEGLGRLDAIWGAASRRRPIPPAPVQLGSAVIPPALPDSADEMTAALGALASRGGGPLAEVVVGGSWREAVGRFAGLMESWVRDGPPGRSTLEADIRFVAGLAPVRRDEVEALSPSHVVPSTPRGAPHEPACAVSNAATATRLAAGSTSGRAGSDRCSGRRSTVKVIDLCRLLLCGQVSASAVPELGDPDIRAEVEQQLAAVGVGLRYAEADRCWVALVDEPLPDDVGLTPIQALNETERAVAAASWLHLVFLPAERRTAATLDGLSLPAEPTERTSVDPDDLYGQFAHRMRRPYFDIVTGKLKRLGFLRLRDGRLEAGPVLAVLGGEPAIAEARRLVAVHKRFLLLRRQAAEITAELGLEPAARSPVDPQPTPASPNGAPPGGPQRRSASGCGPPGRCSAGPRRCWPNGAGLDQARVSRIERGEQPPPGVARSLATALGLRPEELSVDGGEHAAG